MSVIRFGISIEESLLDALDTYVSENHFTNRSQAIRQLINKNVVERKWQCNNFVAGSITLVYSKEKREILNQIAELLTNHQKEVLSSQRIILSKNNFLEIIAVKGLASRLTELSDKLINIKGMQHGKLTMSRAD